MVEGLCDQQTQLQWNTHSHPPLWSQVIVRLATVKCWISSHRGSSNVPVFLLLIVQSLLGLDSLYTLACDVPSRGVSRNHHNCAHHSSGNKECSNTTTVGLSYSKMGPLDLYLTHMWHVTQSYFVCMDIWNEKLSSNPSPGKAKMKHQRNCSNL